MADIRAAQNGDFSATSTWIGGAVPGSGDVAYANSFTVTISDTRTVQAISNAAAGSPVATVGGTFSLLNGCNLTCTNANGVVQGNTTTSCITTASLALGSSASVTSSYTNLSTTIGNATLTHSGSGIVNLTGNVVGGSSGSGNTQYAINLTGSGTLNHIGNVTAGSASAGYGMMVSGAATANITGNISNPSNLANGYGIYLSNTGCNVTITGTVTGGGIGSVANTNGTLTVNGVCQSNSIGPAIGPGVGTQITRLSGPFLLGASGNINPVQAQSWRWAPTLIPTYLEVATSGGSTKRNLYTADNMPSGGYPTAGNVRQSTVYGPSSEFTGTLAVPAASSVALGVATDNTTGTAILTAANVRTAMGLASANLDTQLATAAADSSGVTTLLTRLTSGRAAGLDNLDATVSSRLASASYSAPPSASSIASAVWASLTSGLNTVGSVGKLLADNLDATVSSRLASDGYTAPPSAAVIASAVWSATTRSLTTAIDTSATIAAAVWAYASGRTVTGGTVDTLTNAPTVPSAAQIASQVRTELATELARIDAAISTRLASSSYSTPPTAAAIATAVNSALDRTGYSLTSAERQAIATAVEQSILNENDGQAILNAIVGAIGNTNIDQVALVAAIRADLERTGGTLATRSTLSAAGVRAELSTELARLDAAVSSRLASASYVTPPTTAAIRTELSVELARLDAAVSSRLAPSGTLARVTLVDTTTTVTNSPSSAPSAATVAAAVRFELSPELARVANCSTVDSTATTIQDALST